MAHLTDGCLKLISGSLQKKGLRHRLEHLQRGAYLLQRTKGICSRCTVTHRGVAEPHAAPASPQWSQHHTAVALTRLLTDGFRQHDLCTRYNMSAVGHIMTAQPAPVPSHPFLWLHTDA